MSRMHKRDTVNLSEDAIGVVNIFECKNKQNQVQVSIDDAVMDALGTDRVTFDKVHMILGQAGIDGKSYKVSRTEHNKRGTFGFGNTSNASEIAGLYEVVPEDGYLKLYRIEDKPNGN